VEPGALPLGADYTNTAVGRDARLNLSPSEFVVFGTMKGPSNFDQPYRRNTFRKDGIFNVAWRGAFG